jgi:hypothetical protein
VWLVFGCCLNGDWYLGNQTAKFLKVTDVMLAEGGRIGKTLP